VQRLGRVRQQIAMLVHGAALRGHIRPQRGQGSFQPGRPMDLLRKSGEFPMSYEELDDTAATVYEGI